MYVLHSDFSSLQYSGCIYYLIVHLNVAWFAEWIMCHKVGFFFFFFLPQEVLCSCPWCRLGWLYASADSWYRKQCWSIQQCIPVRVSSILQQMNCIFFQLVQCFIGASELSARNVSVPIVARHSVWCISLLLAFFNMPLHCSLHCSFAVQWKADNLIYRQLRYASCALLCRLLYASTLEDCRINPHPRLRWWYICSQKTL